jgi:xanthine/uracil permease
MKRLFVLIPMLLFGMLLFGQDVPDVPGGVGDILEDPGRFLKQLGGLVGLTIFVVELLKLWLKPPARWQKVLMAIFVGLVFSLLTNLIDFGLFADSPWLNTALWGLGVGAAAGGIFDIPTVRTLVNLLLSIIQFKKPVE